MNIFIYMNNEKIYERNFKMYFAKSSEKQLFGLTCTKEEHLLLRKTLQRFCGLP